MLNIELRNCTKIKHIIQKELLRRVKYLFINDNVTILYGRLYLFT